MKDRAARVITRKCILDTYKLIVANNSIILQFILPNTIDQDILKMYWVDDLNGSEIANKLHLTNRQVQTKYNNLLKKIPRKLEQMINNYIDLLAIASKQVIKNNTVKKQVKLLNYHTNSNPLIETEDINPKNIFIKDVFGNRCTRYVNALNQSGIHTLGNVTFYTKKEILLTPGIGNYFVDELTKIMYQYGLQYKSEIKIKKTVTDNETRFVMSNNRVSLRKSV